MTTEQPRHAYYTDESYQDPSTGLFCVAKIEENEPGFWRMPTLHPTLEAARTEANRLNDELGLHPGDVLDIIASSMGAHNAKKYPSPDLPAMTDPADPDDVLHHITVADVETLHGMVLTEDQAEQVRDRLAQALTNAINELRGIDPNGGAAKLEILHQREPDDECSVRVWVNRVELTDFTYDDIDPGRGHIAEEWDETHRAAIANPDLSESYRAALDQAYTAGRESKYVEDD
jgi:hypothetical protein